MSCCREVPSGRTSSIADACRPAGRVIVEPDDRATGPVGQGTARAGRLRRRREGRDGRHELLGYTRSVPAERIAENLAFINWTGLTGLAIGSFVAVVVARMRTDATRGFLSFTAACAVVLGILAVLSDQALPVPSQGSPIRIDPAFDEPRRIALAAFTVIAGVYVVALSQRRRAPWIAGAGLLAAAATLVFGALAWAGGTLFA